MKNSSYIRNFIFGVEDSLVSTVGLLSGVAAADASRATIALTGAVLIFVEAFSMGVGSYLSEHSTASPEEKADSSRAPIFGGLIMFISYLITGFIPLFPYLVSERPAAFWLSIGLSLAGLFFLGVLSAKMTQNKIFVSGLRMLVLGGLAIGIGVGVGKAVGSAL